MAQKTNYICTNCGSVTAKWFGKCPDCGEWNTLEECAPVSPQPQKTSPASKNSKKYTIPERSRAVPISKVEFPQYMRFSTGIGEFDRVLGGGLVKGSVVLLSGEPGIGKSTLLLQVCKTLCEGNRVLYVSGEESPSQIKLRARRLDVSGDDISVLAETNINKIIPEIDVNSADVVIIDSIQTMYDDELVSAPGTVTQVKQSAMQLITKAKTDGVSIIIVGHVNKDGAIAGPKVLEHMVDAVLYFEGDKQHIFRLVRAAKNRFGSTNEIGVFEMLDNGLNEVPNPSEMLMEQRRTDVSGSCAVCVIEGSRPIIAEIQALTSPTAYPSPRRMSAGIDYNRLALLLAVLEKRLGLKFSTQDVYLNVAGGLRLDEPSADMAAALALISSLRDIPVPEDLIAFGEIGLTGECRSVTGMEIRLNESCRLGFKRIAVPYKAAAKMKSFSAGADIIPFKSIFDLLKLFSQ